MRVRLLVDRLRQTLAQSAQSQNYWAMRLGLSRGHWSDLVNGKHPFPSARTRQRMIEVLGVPFDDLFEIEAGPAPWEVEAQGTVGERYLTDRELGRGGMGVVYLARDLRLGRTVAVKMVSAEAVSGIGAEQFLREIGYAARLHHPHVLPLYDAGELGDQPFYVMAHVRDGSLRERLLERHRLTLERAVPIVRGMAAGLAHAHAHQVLHCDVKPENVLLAGDHAYVADFGVARAIHQESFSWGRRSGVDASAGTPAYVSPEQAAGERDLDARADVYALGAVTFELLAGRPPFVGSTALDTVALRFREPPPDVRQFALDVPADVADALSRALALNRDDRHAGCQAFADDLARAARPGLGRAVRRAAVGTSRIARRLGVPPGFSPGGMMRDVLRDLRPMWRGWRRAPSFPLVIICTLALALGANATMFGLVDRLLLRAPPHIVAPERVHRVHVARWFGGLRSPAPAMSYPAFQDLRDRSTAFSAVAALDIQSASLGSGVGARQVNAVYASGAYFSLLGVRPRLGRFFGEEADALPDGLPVAVLGHDLWQGAYGGDSLILGRTIDLDDRRFEVIGVAPEGFTGTELGRVDVWVPMSAVLSAGGNDGWITSRGSQFLQTFVRLGEGVTPAAAAADAERAYREGHADFDEYEARAVAVLAPLIAGRDPDTGAPEARVSAWLFGMALIVLLIACANVANLILARGLARRGELAIRQALGVSRARLMRQLVTESVVYAGLGALLGLTLAQWGAQVVRGTLLPATAWDASPVGGRVLLVTAVAASLAAVGATLLPYVRSSRIDLARALHEASGRAVAYPRRLLAALLLTQTGLATLLLVGAGLFAQSFQRVSTLDLGFAAQRMLGVRLTLDPAGLASQEIVGFYREAARRIEAVPGVERAGVTLGTPFMGNYAVGVGVPGLDSLPRLPGGGPYIFRVSAGALEALGVRLVRGRLLTEADDRVGAAPVVVITEHMARAVWPESDPLAQCLYIRFSDTPPCARVVGVVEDLHRQQLREPPFLAYFAPLTIDPDDTPHAIVVRTAGPPAAMVAPVRRAILGLRSDLPYIDVEPYEDIIAPQARSWRLGAAVFAVFGLLSLVIAAIGVYGVLTFTTAQRLPEMGIRTVLGATPGAIMRSVLVSGAGVACAGAVLGGALALLLSGRVEALLFETSGREPVVYLVAAGAVVVLALAASFAPAIRAARADPLAALRAQ